MKDTVRIPPTEVYEIDRGIPVPPKSPLAKYPFHSMKVGDSFFVPGGGAGLKSAITSRQRSHPNEKYTRRTKSNGIRVWRVL